MEREEGRKENGEREGGRIRERKEGEGEKEREERREK